MIVMRCKAVPHQRQHLVVPDERMSFVVYLAGNGHLNIGACMGIERA